MSIEVKLRRGTTVEHETFTGAQGEATIDTDKNTIVVHDGSTPGGHPLLNLDNLPARVCGPAFNIAESLVVGTDLVQLIIPLNCTIIGGRIEVTSPPSSADLIVDINLNGVTLWTTQGNRPTILVSETSSVITAPDVVGLSQGDTLSLDIDQGDGSNLRLTLFCEEVLG